VIAEYERAKILERGRRGRRHAAQSGSVSELTGLPTGIATLAWISHNRRVARDFELRAISKATQFLS